MQVWDDVGPGYVRYSAAEAGLAEMGHVAENDAVQSALASRLGDAAERIWPATISSIEFPPCGPHDLGEAAAAKGPAHLAEIRLEGGRTLRCRLVVGADGARSRTRSLGGLRAVGWQYDQRGVVACVRTETPNEVAWQSFLSTGPLALLPVRDGFSNVVWSTTPEIASALEAMGPEEFAAAVNRALSAGGPRGSGGVVGGFASAASRFLFRGQPPFEEFPRVLEYTGAPPKSFPLQMLHSGRYVRPRLALVGDAAHAVHPLAGQGVNLGFGDAKELAAAIAHATKVGCDIGDAGFLAAHYEGPRRTANLAMMGALDSLKAVFGVQMPSFAGLRNLGLQVVNATPPLKREIMAYAMG
uniref:Ubiquinone biosynthesis monooxygenase Coq6 n=1 Tax=Tetraselmis sp. GSL018 TaxID=582737 RepID=A0A061SIF6_9CHLO